MEDKNTTQNNPETNAEQRQTQTPGQTTAGDGTTGAGDEFRTPFEQVMDTARDQATAAAGALRRGEFVQDASIDPAASSDDRLIALLAYISQIFVPAIMPIIILLSESSKKRPFQRYHAVQALALSAVFVVAGVAAVMGTVVAQIVPFVGGVFALAVACLSPVAFLMYVIAMLYYGYQSYQGKRFAIPGLTSFLRDQGWIA